MLSARLSLAIDAGGLVLPQGRIGVFHPPIEADLSDLPKERCHIIQPLYPAHASFEAQGYACDVAPSGAYEMCIICLPRAKNEARALIALAQKHCDGVIVVDGQKLDGIDSMFKALKKRGEVSAAISKAHGKLFWFTQMPVLEDWQLGPALTPGGFWTAPGVFSADAVDPASQLLVSALPEDLGQNLADLGAGWGYLSAHVLTRDIKSIHLVEANHMALECAKRNVTDERAQFHWADATKWAPTQRIDTVIMNPPFHVGRAAQVSLGQAFVAAAGRILKPQGHLWMVANRHLPYEETLKAHFAQVSDIGEDPRFKLFHASKPLHKRVSQKRN